MTIKTATYFLFSGLLVACSQSREAKLLWSKSLYQIGSQSSPKATDLNGDGTLDIVFGAGTEEIASTEYGVVALDGKTGELLWQQSATASIVGSATFYDITGDSIDDIFIGGRNHNLMALNGANGEVIWKYEYVFEDDSILQYARYNFYNSTLVPDQNNDGHPDLLTVNGGNWDALPGSINDRFPGVLMLLDLQSGTILAADTMPDGQESYMSPLYFTQPDRTEGSIIFGTGGETAGGHLYQATLADLKAQRLQNATVLVSEETHGFIAPPVVTDITQDGYFDIVIASHASQVHAVDGKTMESIWTRSFPQMECSSGFAVGQFTGDATPDFLAIMSQGTWPDYTIATQVVLNGKDGTIAYQDSIGCFSLTSPVVYDINNDGLDEAILSVGDYDCAFQLSEEVRSPATINTQLVAIDFSRNQYQVIDQSEGFKNFYSTPWLGDLDQDNYLDVVYPQYYNANDLFRFLGMTVKRLDTGIRMNKPVLWGEYMGINGKSVFPS
ncbi:MAG: PQQ-binding-like beta-propeller repeat protein [Tunicatimonas sp.]|uniref:FG-GAP repeat domain-containing protein n=1 Tax=Tunicatimonas sp. TaxID=1940096 RepID=UPI003C79245C